MNVPLKKNKIPHYNHKNKYSSGILNKLIKKRKNTADDSDSGNESGEENPLFPFFGNNTDNQITHKDNHIYFREDITLESINKLINIINTKNNEFNKLKNKKILDTITPKPIYLHITSHGGDLHEGLMGADAIINSEIPIYTIIEGYAASAATF